MYNGIQNGMQIAPEATRRGAHLRIRHNTMTPRQIVHNKTMAFSPVRAAVRAPAKCHAKLLRLEHKTATNPATKIATLAQTLDIPGSEAANSEESQVLLSEQASLFAPLHDQLRISVITVSQRGSAALLPKLENLCAQQLPAANFECILYLNSCCDDSAYVISQRSWPFSLRLLQSETRQPLSVARNACAVAARGELLYFSDEACMLNPATLERHVQAHQGRASSVVVGAVDFLTSKSVRRWQPKQASYWHCNSLNTSLPRHSFVACGGFDEMLRGYGGNSFLLGYRLHSQGLRFRALPEAKVQYRGLSPQQAGDSNKAESAGRNAARIAARYPELSWRLWLQPWQLYLRRWALLEPWGSLWRYLRPQHYAYKRAYIQGAWEEYHRAKRSNS